MVEATKVIFSVLRSLRRGIFFIFMTFFSMTDKMNDFGNSPTYDINSASVPISGGEGDSEDEIQVCISSTNLNFDRTELSVNGISTSIQKVNVGL